MSSTQLSQLANILWMSILAFSLVHSPEALAQDNWQFRAAMPTPRSGAGAAVLDGIIYVIGGEDDNGNVLTTVEQYDPLNNTWVTGVDIQKARSQAGAITHNGRIHVMGGRDQNLPLKQVEIFIPEDDPPGILCGDDDDSGAQKPPPCWSFIDDFEKEREGITAVVLDNVLYALSGSDKGGKFLTSVEFFDENGEGEWRIFPSWQLNPGRFSFATVAVEDSAFSIGGISSFGPLSLVQRYHPDFGTVDRSPLPSSRGGLAAVEVDNSIYAIGGREVNNQLTGRVDQFVVEENQWLQKAPLNTPREDFTAVSIGSQIFIIGGRDADGNALSSVEMLDLEDIPEIPELQLPVNGETELPPTVTLTWNTEIGATSDLQVASTEDFSSIFFEAIGLVGETYELSGLSPLATYYWRVRSVKSTGESDWSAPFSFTTNPGLPATPQLLEPSDGAVDISGSITLSWQADQGTTSQLQISTDEIFSDIVVDQADLETPSFEFTGLISSTIYYWRVRAVNDTGPSAWSNVYRFTTAGTLPAAPILLEPGDGEVNVSRNVTLTWSVEPEVSSELQVATDEGFAMLLIDETGIDSVSYELTALAPLTSYYWRIRAINDTGPGVWSMPYWFTTANNVSTDQEQPFEDFELNENYPNPFSGKTTINFRVSANNGASVELVVFDLLGRQVKTLINGSLPAGNHQVQWDGRNDTGKRVHSGLFVYQLRQGAKHIERKMMIIH